MKMRLAVAIAVRRSPSLHLPFLRPYQRHQLSPAALRLFSSGSTPNRGPTDKKGDEDEHDATATTVTSTNLSHAVDDRPVHLSTADTSTSNGEKKPSGNSDSIRGTSSGSSGLPSFLQSGRGGRLVDLWQQYGVVAIGTYLSVYVGTLGALFAGIETGAMVPSSLPIGDESLSTVENAAEIYRSLARRFHLDSMIDVDNLSPTWGNFLVAWVLTKFTEPARALVTVALTPSIARRLGRVNSAPPPGAPPSPP